ncbi:sensor domain-containing diguanylate cyclase [Vibrio sp. YMD68]|uniref:sensor domain-containing diguanylate cyclase n=1 Tax=Vibrio sp. YMD68 TaxID=3042300 RepID=UPI002499E4ED|nr:sensor domain-containing diguanylate cyclase [Vibrio sp. YMD68]WGV98394.1 sensor domain-containing diguanylate cyclase [Vibrio sp. YMD68]
MFELNHDPTNTRSKELQSEKHTYFPLEFFDELSQAKTLGDILRSTSFWIKQIFQSDRVSIALQQEPDFLSLFALSGNEAIPLEHPIPIANTMVGHVFTREKLAICNDTSREAWLDCQWLAEGGLLSCMDAPLVSNGKCYGTINIGHHDKNHFHDQDARVISSLVSWIASQVRVQQHILEMEILANIDTLTGIMNRRAFFEATQLINDKPRAFDKNHALLVIDIDHFKQLNDQHGHLGGDEFLIAMTKKIQDIKRKSDVFARLGGEEFVLLLSEVTEADAATLAEKYRLSIEGMVTYYKEKPLTCTVSIGISSPKLSDQNFRDVLSRADAALYDAKNSGRNRVCCWNEKSRHQ